MYEQIRKFAIIFFIAAVAVVAVIVIFAIWGIFNSDVIGKSFESLAILILSAALIGVTTLLREGKASMVISGSQNTSVAPANPNISVGKVILYVFLILIAIPILFGFVVGLLGIR